MAPKLGHIPWNKGKKGVQVSTRKGIHLSNETKKKISEARKKQGNCWKGRKHTEESKRKISEAKKGNKNNSNRLGTKHTPESIQKMRVAHIGLPVWNKGLKGAQVSHRKGKPMPESTRLKLISTMNTPESRQKRSGNNSPRYIDGRSYDGYCPKFNNHLKERVRDRDNRTCQLCGEKENGHKLDVHHVHYDKKNCSPDLIALCHKCHLQVPFERQYYESLFMNKLNSRGLLLWTTTKPISDKIKIV